jgi:hypothetical protein
LTMTMHVAIVSAQKKAQSYTKQAPRDDFIPLVIKTWLFPSLFWFLFYFLCTCQYNSPLANLHGTFDAYILLETMNVDSPPTCASRPNPSSWFFIFSTHTNSCTKTSWFVAKDALLTLGLLLHYYCFRVLVFLVCVYICFNMPCTFCGWISILVYIYIHGFLTIKDKKEHFVRDFVCVCVFVFFGTW